MSTQNSSGMTKSTGKGINQSAEDISSTQIYFAVSLPKLVVMSICTIGFYEFYWFYKNWVIIKERDRLHIRPFWRAVFAIFYCYSFFQRVQVSAKAISLKKSISPGVLALGWLLFRALMELPDPYWLVTVFTFMFLLPVQSAVNNINDSVAPGHDKNGKYTIWNIIGVILAIPIYVNAIWEMFWPEV